MWLVQVGRMNKWQIQDSDPGRLALESKLFPTALYSLPVFGLFTAVLLTLFPAGQSSSPPTPPFPYLLFSWSLGAASPYTRK